MNARQIAVIGSSTPNEGLTEVAREVGRLLAAAGAVVVCGGLRGVMEAVAEGANEAGGEVIGIVPSTAPADANPHCTHVVAAGIGTARNLSVVASGEAVIAVGGAWGTLSEIAYARHLGRRVIALGSWEIEAPDTFEAAVEIVEAASPAEAVELALAER